MRAGADLLEAWAGREVVEIVRHLSEWSALGIEVLAVAVSMVAVFIVSVS